MTTNIQEVQTAVAEFDRVAAGIAELKQSYAGVVYEVTTTKGMEAAKAARAAVREPRYEVERVRKLAKAPILALGNLIDKRAKEITSELLALESPIDEQIKNEEARKEAERQAKIAAERKRVEDIQSWIGRIQSWPVNAVGKPASLVEQQLRMANEYVIDERFAEFAPQATAALSESREKLTAILTERRAFDVEQKRLADEKAKADIAAAEQAAKLKAEREQFEKEQAAERKRVEEARAELERKEAELRKAQAASVPEPTANDDEIVLFDDEPAPKPIAVRAPPSPYKPSETQIIAVISNEYGVSMETAREWLASYRFDARVAA